MTWLQGAQSAHRSRMQERQPSAEVFASLTVIVERDLESQQMVTEVIDGHTWVCAWESYELLETVRGEEVDHMQLTGRQLKMRLRSLEWSGVGIMWRPDRDVEYPVVWPQAAPVSRVTVE